MILFRVDEFRFTNAIQMLLRSEVSVFETILFFTLSFFPALIIKFWCVDQGFKFCHLFSFCDKHFVFSRLTVITSFPKNARDRSSLHNVEKVLNENACLGARAFRKNTCFPILASVLSCLCARVQRARGARTSRAQWMSTKLLMLVLATATPPARNISLKKWMCHIILILPRPLPRLPRNPRIIFFFFSLWKMNVSQTHETSANFFSSIWRKNELHTSGTLATPPRERFL